MQRCLPCLHIFCLTVLLGGLMLACSGCMRPDGRLLAAHTANTTGFTPQRFDTPEFVLKGWLRPAQLPDQHTLHVYIEGDGLAWLTRRQPSSDPTPTSPVALELASADPTPQAVLYLARPCQYTDGADRRDCTPRDWTTDRFSAKTLRALHTALNEAKQRTHTTQLALYGFSGGGGIAALLTAQRDDVLFLGTVAGNLDHTAWTRHHAVSPLTGSLNPADFVQQTADVPQLHVTGSDDIIIPPHFADAWCDALPQTRCVRRTVAGTSHSGPWTGTWPVLVQELRPPLP